VLSQAHCYFACDPFATNYVALTVSLRNESCFKNFLANEKHQPTQFPALLLPMTTYTVQSCPVFFRLFCADDMQRTNTPQDDKLRNKKKRPKVCDIGAVIILRIFHRLVLIKEQTKERK